MLSIAIAWNEGGRRRATSCSVCEGWEEEEEQCQAKGGTDLRRHYILILNLLSRVANCFGMQQELDSAGINLYRLELQLRARNGTLLFGFSLSA